MPTYSLTLRSELNRKLTIQELDNNFLYVLENASGGGGATVSFENITYSELYNKVVNEELTPLQWYRLTDYKSVNFLNGYDLAEDNPTPVDPNFNPREVYVGDTEVLLLQAISNNEISSIGYSENFQGEIVEYRPYTNKLGLEIEITNGAELPDSSIVSGFDLQWDGENVFFEMPNDFPALYGQIFYFNATFDGGSYRVSQAYSPLSPNNKLTYVEYPSPPDKTTNIRVENGGSKIVLLDLTEADFLDYDVDTLFVYTKYALDDAYGEIVRRIDTIKNIDVPFDFRGIKYRRFECEILGNITGISYTATGSTATDNVYTINSGGYTTDTAQGQNAEFKITVDSGSVVDVQIFKSGRLYATSETFTIDGTQIGGTSGVDDVVITIDDINSNIDYWGIGDVFRDATTTGNYEDFPVFNYVVEDVANIKWNKSYDIGSTYDNNVFFGEFGNVEFKGIVGNNTCGDDFKNNTVGDFFYNNTVGNDFYKNTVSDYFNNNTVGHGFYDNTVGNDFNYNTVGDKFNNNTVGNGFYDNTVGNDFNYNTVGNYFQNNTVGNDFYKNTVSDYFNNNTVGESFAYNKIGNYFYNNTIDEGFGYGFSTSQGNVIGNYFYNNTVGEYFYNNTIIDGFYNNIIGDYFQLNSVKVSVTGIDFEANPATHVYANYNCDVFRASDSNLYLSYFDGTDVQYDSIDA